MKIIDISYKRVLPVAILLLVFLAGCVTTKAKHNISDEEGLRERVVSYWDYRIKGDLDKSYGYEDPLYRKAVTLVQYIRRSNDIIDVKAVKVGKVALENDTAQVDLDMQVEVHAPGARPLKTQIQRKEKWGKVDGIWYHVIEKRSLQGKNGLN